MTTKNVISLAVLMICFCNANARQPVPISPYKALIEVQMASPFTPVDSISKSLFELRYSSLELIGITSSFTEARGQANDDRIKWLFEISEPVKVRGVALGRSFRNFFILEPGDSVVIGLKDGGMRFSGAGSVKFLLVQRLTTVIDSLGKVLKNKGLSRKYQIVTSYKDYLAWSDFLDEKAKVLTRLLDQYRTRISVIVYNSLKSEILSEIEITRLRKFRNLLKKPRISETGVFGSTNDFGLTQKDLGNIYDRLLNTQSGKWLQVEAPFVRGLDYQLYLYSLVSLEVYYQKNGFFYNALNNDSLLAGDKRYWLYYNHAKRRFDGPIRNAVLAFIITHPEAGIRKTGFTPLMEEMLADYLNQSVYTDYKQYVAEYTNILREDINGKMVSSDRIYNFWISLYEVKGTAFSLANVLGKIAVVNFWNTESKNVFKSVTQLKKLQDDFINDTNVVFVNISVEKDRERWLQSISQKQLFQPKDLHLYTGGLGTEHILIRKYAIGTFPSIFIISPRGDVISRPVLSSSEGYELATLNGLIYRQLALLKDGPYTFYSNDQITAYSINNKSVDTSQFSRKTPISFTVATDDNKDFSVRIQKKLGIEPTEFEAPAKIFVLSDIEGNFSSFRKLLHSNAIIDDKFNWVFGNGHLVFAGDMFDRGEQVTECLWLIYSLEEKAKKVGGHVHFILGNHEIMNLQGNDSYVKSKYKRNYILLKKNLTEMYGTHTELGRWLRTKNIIEKIGDNLFMHGGISPAINQTTLSLENINKLAKKYYANKNKIQSANNNDLTSIFGSETSPFWYRGYYEKEEKSKAGQAQVDSTLQKFNVNRIITGHTIVADTISVHYGGKVINTDTKHAEGKSEALLIEGDKYYRVNQEGQRVLLFVDEKKKPN